MIPSQNFDADLLLKAQSIKIAFFDVDGVLTDGTIFYASTGEMVKNFNVLDGFGFKLLLQVGIVPAVITGRDSGAIRKRLADLGIKHAAFACQNKVLAAQEILTKLGMSFDQAACMGDDWPDLMLMRQCRVCCAPINAHIETKNLADYITTQKGGEGAARQWCDVLLTATGRYRTLLEASLS